MSAKTAGEVLSDLARRGILWNTHDQKSDDSPFVLKNGWYVLPSRGGVIVTNEMVRRLQEELDEEEARRKGGY